MSQRDYTLHELLGTGMAGEVHRAVHTPSQTTVALKQVRTTDARMVRAVEQEVRAMARVSHPNLLAIYDHGRLLAGDGLWLALEYASGGSLEDWEPSGWDEIWLVLDDVLHGLAHAHARGLVHRDLKPANLLRALPTDVSPGVKIGDFGLTTLRGVDPAVRRGGTPVYMAPEQWTREAAGPRSDLYGLGCILWEWTTGRPPFQGDIEGLRTQHREASLPAFVPRFDVPAALGPLLQELLAKLPAGRPASAGEVRRRLQGTPPERAVQQLMLSPTLPPVPPGLGLALQPLRDHAVVGREAERRGMIAVLKQVVAERRAHVQLLSGPAGVGRTRLARWIAETAAEAGVAELLVSPTVAEAQEAAERGVVVVLFDDLGPDIETRLRALLHTQGPLLAVACVDAAWHWEGSSDAIHRLELGPMDRTHYRWFIESQLGLTHAAARRLGPGEGVPGVAAAWTHELGARGKLVPTPQGFDIRGALPPAPSLHDREKGLVEVLCSRAAPEELRAMQAAAMLGDVVEDEAWEGALERLGLPFPPLADALSQVGVFLRRPDHWRWSSRALRQAVLGDDALPADWTAVADTLDALPGDPARGIRAGLARLAGGDVERARQRLLVYYPMRMNLWELVGEAVEALRPHMADATVTQRILHLRLDLLAHMNLGNPIDGEPMARQLARMLGTRHAPGPLRDACDPDERQRALETAASVFVHLGRFEQVATLLEGIPETPDTLRTRAMAAAYQGDLPAAEALARRGYGMTKAGEARRAFLANLLGVAAGAAGRHDEAERWFRESVGHTDATTSFTQMLNVAVAICAQGRYDEALEPARQGLELAERAGKLIPHAYVTYAIVAALAGRTDDVRRFGDTALAMVRQNPQTAIETLAEPASRAHTDDPVIQRFLDALRPLIP